MTVRADFFVQTRSIASADVLLTFQYQRTGVMCSNINSNLTDSLFRHSVICTSIAVSSLFFSIKVKYTLAIPSRKTKIHFHDLNHCRLKNNVKQPLLQSPWQVTTHVFGTSFLLTAHQKLLVSLLPHFLHEDSQYEEC